MRVGAVASGTFKSLTDDDAMMRDRVICLANIGSVFAGYPAQSQRCP